VDAKTIALADGCPGDVPMPDEAGRLGEVDSRLHVVLIEEAQLDPVSDL
jgi:hypothetical protein